MTLMQSQRSIQSYTPTQHQAAAHSLKHGTMENLTQQKLSYCPVTNHEHM